MYGKHFQSMYTGSLVGKGPTTFAVWGYVIAHAHYNTETVELNPKLLAFVLGGTEEEVVTAIEILCSPDPDSRSKENEGRRLERTGQFLYKVTNLQRYRDIADEEARREYLRLKKREERARTKSTPVNKCQHASTKSTQGEAEGEAEAEASTSSKEDVGNVDFVSLLSADPTYAGIDVPREFGKMQNWCKVNNKQPTKRRFINWLNRADRPLTTTSKPVDDWRRYDKLGRRVDASGRLMDANQIREADMLHKWEEERKAAKAKV